MERTPNMPALVYWGLWGIRHRRVAMGFLWVAMGLALVSLVLGFSDPRLFWGVLLFVAAGWYWYAIRWADENSLWEHQ